MIAFLAHFAPGFGNPLKMTSRNCHYWYHEAAKLNIKMNKVDDNG